jgi:hypothetical protein
MPDRVTPPPAPHKRPPRLATPEETARAVAAWQEENRKRLKITPLRIRALELVLEHPGITGGAIARKLEYRGRYNDGRPIPSWPQGDTRWGCGYMAPLVSAGLVSKRVYRVDVGGAAFTITPAGEQWLQDALLQSGLQGN